MPVARGTVLCPAALPCVVRVSRYRWLSTPPLRFHPQQLVNLFYCVTSGQCTQEFWHPCSSGASRSVREGLVGIKSTHHWKSMMCLMCFFATSKSTLPSGHCLHTSKYSKDTFTGFGVMPANKLNFRLTPRSLEADPGRTKDYPVMSRQPSPHQHT